MLHEDSDTWAPSAPPAEGAVRLLTVHGSKGLEFEAVFVSGLTEDRFPVGAGRQLVDPGLLATGPHPEDGSRARHLFEERRLLYVAITRAKTYLCLTGVEEGAEDGAKASPFLRELEGRLIELERERAAGSGPPARRPSRSSGGQPATASFPSRALRGRRALLEMGERASTAGGGTWRDGGDARGAGAPDCAPGSCSRTWIVPGGLSWSVSSRPARRGARAGCASAPPSKKA